MLNWNFIREIVHLSVENHNGTFYNGKLFALNYFNFKQIKKKKSSSNLFSMEVVEWNQRTHAHTHIHTTYRQVQWHPPTWMEQGKTVALFWGNRRESYTRHYFQWQTHKQCKMSTNPHVICVIRTYESSKLTQHLECIWVTGGFLIKWVLFDNETIEQFFSNLINIFEKFIFQKIINC